jgi:hypothetical protein
MSLIFLKMERVLQGKSLGNTAVYLGVLKE